MPSKRKQLKKITKNKHTPSSVFTNPAYDSTFDELELECRSHQRHLENLLKGLSIVVTSQKTLSVDKTFKPLIDVVDTIVINRIVNKLQTLEYFPEGVLSWRFKYRICGDNSVKYTSYFSVGWKTEIVKDFVFKNGLWMAATLMMRIAELRSVFQCPKGAREMAFQGHLLARRYYDVVPPEDGRHFATLLKFLTAVTFLKCCGPASVKHGQVHEVYWKTYESECKSILKFKSNRDPDHSDVSRQDIVSFVRRECQARIPPLEVDLHLGFILIKHSLIASVPLSVLADKITDDINDDQIPGHMLVKDVCKSHITGTVGLLYLQDYFSAALHSYKLAQLWFKISAISDCVSSIQSLKISLELCKAAVEVCRLAPLQQLTDSPTCRTQLQNLEGGCSGLLYFLLYFMLLKGTVLDQVTAYAYIEHQAHAASLDAEQRAYDTWLVFVVLLLFVFNPKLADLSEKSPDKTGRQIPRVPQQVYLAMLFGIRREKPESFNHVTASVLSIYDYIELKSTRPAISNERKTLLLKEGFFVLTLLLPIMEIDQYFNVDSRKDGTELENVAGWDALLNKSTNLIVEEFRDAHPPVGNCKRKIFSEVINLNLVGERCTCDLRKGPTKRVMGEAVPFREPVEVLNDGSATESSKSDLRKGPSEECGASPEMKCNFCLKGKGDCESRDDYTENEIPEIGTDEDSSADYDEIQNCGICKKERIFMKLSGKKPKPEDRNPDEKKSKSIKRKKTVTFSVSETSNNSDENKPKDKEQEMPIKNPEPTTDENQSKNMEQNESVAKLNLPPVTLLMKMYQRTLTRTSLSKNLNMKLMKNNQKIWNRLRLEKKKHTQKSASLPEILNVKLIKANQRTLNKLRLSKDLKLKPTLHRRIQNRKSW